MNTQNMLRDVSVDCWNGGDKITYIISIEFKKKFEVTIDHRKNAKFKYIIQYDLADYTEEIKNNDFNKLMSEFSENNDEYIIKFISSLILISDKTLK